MAAMLAAVMLLSGALPAAAATDRMMPAGEGLYVTDDGAYEVCVNSGDPGSVTIVKCLVGTLPADLLVPAAVPLNGVEVPVTGLMDVAYDGHDEIQVVRFDDNMHLIADEPFRGCSSLREVYLPGDGMTLLESAFTQQEQMVTVFSQPLAGGNPADYVDISFSTTDMRADNKLAVTFTLREGTDNFTAYLYLNTALRCVSMEPDDPEAHLHDGLAGLRLGPDPIGGTDYGRTRTLYFEGDRSVSLNPRINLAASVLAEGSLTEWMPTTQVSYYVPNGAGSTFEPYHHYEYLPVPEDVAPMQKAVLDGTNAIRRDAGASELERSKILNQAAMVRATEMALADDLSHTRPDGSEWRTVIRGYATGFGENIIQLGSGLDTAAAASAAVSGWRNSAGHYQNMIGADFTDMGVGFARSRNGTWYGCQLFSNSGKSFVRTYSIDGVKLLEPYYPANGDLSIDKEALKEAIQEAKKILAETVSSADGTNVPPSQPWTNPEQKQLLEENISETENILNENGLTQEAVDSAAQSLQGAVKYFVSYRRVSQQDKEPLKSAVEAAKALQSATVSSKDGAEVSSAQYWATPEAMRTLSAEISVAEIYIEQRDVTGALLDYASEKFRQAADAFAAARRPGLKLGPAPVPSGAPTASVPPSTGDQSTVSPSAGPQPTVSASAKPSVSTSPSASASPTSSATVAPRPSASVLPSSPPMPTAVTVPEIAGIEGYQGGRLNGKVYYMKTSGASMLLYQQRSNGSMGRVSVPYVTNAEGTRYYPVNCGGTVLFPRFRNGSLEAYWRYEDGREIPVLAVQTIPGAAEDLQQFSLNGRQYYARTSGASMLFYQRRSSGSLGRVSAPYVTDKNGTRFYPVNCGGTVLIPQLKNGALDSYMAGTAAVLTPAA